MNLVALSPSSITALSRSLAYWAAHWDWECPLLFGVELHELKAILEAWPNVEAGSERHTALALLSSLRELLYGASALPRAKLPTEIGLTYAEADALCAEVQTIVAAYEL